MQTVHNGLSATVTKWMLLQQCLLRLITTLSDYRTAVHTLSTHRCPSAFACVRKALLHQ